MTARRTLGLCFGLLLFAACGPVPKPKDAYIVGSDILRDFQAKAEQIHSFRITGRVDHFGEAHRIQGKTFLFAKLPDKLRVELVSPFGSPLSVLTVNETVFSLHDIREGTFQTGPSDPCNIARLIQIPLPAKDVIRILVGFAPVIDGDADVKWDTKGFYRVTVKDGERIERLEIGPDKKNLPLRHAMLEDRDGIIFDITYSRRQDVSGMHIPHEIRVKMPREKADLALRYDPGGVELNVALPDDAWSQSPPDGIPVETVECTTP